MTVNRWGIAIAGVVMQVALGAVYAWSVFRVPLAKQFGWSIPEVTLTFTISIFVLGIAAFSWRPLAQSQGAEDRRLNGRVSLWRRRISREIFRPQALVVVPQLRRHRRNWIRSQLHCSSIRACQMVSGSQRNDHWCGCRRIWSGRAYHCSRRYAAHSSSRSIGNICLSGSRLSDSNGTPRLFYAKST